MPEQISLNISFLIILLLLALSAFLAWWQYGYPRLEPANWKLFIPAALRLMTWFAVFLLILKPILHLQFTAAIKPLTHIYLDNSLSMGLTDGQTTRWDSVLLAQKQLNSLNNARTFFFNSEVRPFNVDSTVSPEGETNYEIVKEHLTRAGAEQAVIISDGNVTRGKFLPEIQIPNTTVHFVGIGDSEMKPDVYLESVDFKSPVYLDQEQTLVAHVGLQKRIKRQRVKVTLLDDKKQVAQKWITLSGKANSRQDVELSYVPAALGTSQLRVLVSKIPQETNVNNNQYRFETLVLKSKLKIVLISGVPDYDSRFLQFLLEKEPRFKVLRFFENKTGQISNFAELQAITDADLYILNGFPGRNSDARIIQRIARQIKQGKSHVAFFPNGMTDFRKLAAFKSFLPWETLPTSSASKKIDHFEVTSDINGADIFFGGGERSFWNKLPPVRALAANQDLSARTRVLLKSGSIPVIMSTKWQGVQSITWNAEGFWKWHFLFQDDDVYRDRIQALLTALMRRIAQGVTIKPVSLETAATSYVVGQPIRFVCRLRDSEFKEVADGIVSVQIAGKNAEIRMEVSSTGDTYQFNFRPANAGKLFVKAIGYVDGNEAGSDSLTLQVQPIQSEFVHTTLNQNYLKRLAHTSNGHYFRYGQLDSLVKILDLPARLHSRQTTIELWQNYILLIVILMAAFLEWMIRKRLGLV